MTKRVYMLVLVLLTLLVASLSAQPQEVDPQEAEVQTTCSTEALVATSWLPEAAIAAYLGSAPPIVPSWREDLQKGDILLCRTPDSPFFCLDFMKSVMDWTHIGIYDGKGGVIEGWHPAVHRSTIESSDYPWRVAVRAVRVRGVTHSQADSAVAFAESKLGLGYDFVFLQKGMTGDRWYCSELVWASYTQTEVDLDPDAFVVTPDEIAVCPRVEFVGEHIEYWEPAHNVNDEHLSPEGAGSHLDS